MNNYFITTCAKISDGWHDYRLCKIFREDEEFYYAKVLVRDAFVRLDKIDSAVSELEQHSHFIDTFETSDKDIELKLEKEYTSSFGFFQAYKRIEIPNNNVSSVYFINDKMVKNYKLSLFHLNIELYKHLHKIEKLNFLIEKQKNEVFESEQKKEHINRRIDLLHNIQCNENRLLVLESIFKNLQIDTFIEPPKPKPKAIIEQAVYPKPVSNKPTYVKPTPKHKYDNINFDSDSD